jgi:hypothetical protein
MDVGSPLRRSGSTAARWSPALGVWQPLLFFPASHPEKAGQTRLLNSNHSNHARIRGLPHRRMVGECADGPQCDFANGRHFAHSSNP